MSDEKWLCTCTTDSGGNTHYCYECLKRGSFAISVWPNEKELHEEIKRLRAENERLIGVVDIEVERKAALMAENEQLKKCSVENYRKSADVWEKERDQLRAQLAKAKECLELVARINHQWSNEMIAEVVERARKTLGEIK